MRLQTIPVVAILLTSNCGRNDARNRSCVLAGENCHAESTEGGPEDRDNIIYIPRQPGDGAPSNTESDPRSTTPDNDQNPETPTGTTGITCGIEKSREAVELTCGDTMCTISLIQRGAVISCTGEDPVVILEQNRKK